MSSGGKSSTGCGRERASERESESERKSARAGERARERASERARERASKGEQGSKRAREQESKRARARARARATARARETLLFSTAMGRRDSRTGRGSKRTEQGARSHLRVDKEAMHVRLEHVGPHEALQPRRVQLLARDELVVLVHLVALRLLELLRERVEEGAPVREGGSECTVGTRVGATVGGGERVEE